MILIIKLLLKMRSYISKMEISYCHVHSNYLTSRTAIVREQKQFIKIAFAVHLSAAISAERYRSDSGALKSAVPILVYFYIIMINKYRQSAAQSCLKNNLLLNRSTDKPFENRPMKKVRPCTFFIPEFCLGKTLKAIITAIRGGKREKINRRRTLCTLRFNFFETPQQAALFSKEVGGIQN